MNCLKTLLLATTVLLTAPTAFGQPLENRKYSQADAFRQLEEWLPTPSDAHAVNGAPGPRYWQQRADYDIDVKLDDENQSIHGSETITYYNRSPLPLGYLWLQLDQNLYSKDSLGSRSTVAPSLSGKVSFKAVDGLLYEQKFDGGFKIDSLRDDQGNTLPYSVVDTMMRVDLPKPLTPGQTAKLNIDWHFNIVDAKRRRTRGGFEFFEKDKNYIYEIAQFFPPDGSIHRHGRLATQTVSWHWRVRFELRRL